MNEIEKTCETCAFYCEGRNEQPCCYCSWHNCWEENPYESEEEE